VSEELAQKFGFDPAAHVRVANPIASDQNLMRMSLVPGIWRNLAENRKHFERFRLFEIGREIHKQTQGLPREIPHLVAAIYSRDEAETNLFELKRAAECLMPGAEACPAIARPYEHPARSADILWSGELVGRLFELHPSLIEGRAAILDLDLPRIQQIRPRDRTYTPLRRYPSSQFDLSVIGRPRAGGRSRQQSCGVCGRSSRIDRIRAPILRAAPAGTYQERFVSLDGGFCGADPFLRRGRRYSRTHHRQHARPWL
jgi:phenylalanyl-tRNA synthetase beta chain